jgi:hypothetical protein
MQTIVAVPSSLHLAIARAALGIMLAAGCQLFLGTAFSPRNTQMNANGKELVLDFAKLSECDTSSCRLEFNAALDEKRYEGSADKKACHAKAFFVSCQLV